jgi:hypothetical protein
VSPDARRGLAAARLVPRAQQHKHAFGGKLANDFFADAFVRTGHQGNRLIWFHADGVIVARPCARPKLVESGYGSWYGSL